MNHAVWIYPWDLLDEGIPNVLDRLQAAGISGVNVAVNYHTGRFFLPHNPKRKLYYPEPGALYFEPDLKWYGESKIKPPISEFASRKFYSSLREETSKRSMKLTAWSLGLHNTYIGEKYPETATINVFGDIDITSLCAANEDVRKYFFDLYSDLANNYHFDQILIESMEFMPFRHGYHHEVIGIPLTATEDFLMSLSFSAPLCKKAIAAGIDINAVKDFVKGTLENGYSNAFSSKSEISWVELDEAVGGEMKNFLDFREELVKSLLIDISALIKRNNKSELAILDFGPLYSMGPRNNSWQSGLNLEVVSSYADEVHPTFYFTDGLTFRKKVDEYVNLLGIVSGEVKMVPAIRAILPQVGSLEELKEQVEYLKPHSKGMTFYNYGFMSYETLDWISKSIA
jgi:hypothetical protein